MPGQKQKGRDLQSYRRERRGVDQAKAPHLKIPPSGRYATQVTREVRRSADLIPSKEGFRNPRAHVFKLAGPSKILTSIVSEVPLRVVATHLPSFPNGSSKERQKDPPGFLQATPVLPETK